MLEGACAIVNDGPSKFRAGTYKDYLDNFPQGFYARFAARILAAGDPGWTAPDWVYRPMMPHHHLPDALEKLAGRAVQALKKP